MDWIRSNKLQTIQNAATKNCVDLDKLRMSQGQTPCKRVTTDTTFWH